MRRARLVISPILGAVIASAALIALLGYMLPGAPAHADLLIVAPHPDDDLVTAAGVILRARQAGDTVWVLFVTNGDVLGIKSGLRRQDEAVEALALLDVPEDNIIFLGYPDGSLRDMRGPYAAADKARAAKNKDRQTTTFGERGLGHAEYHRYAFGAPAKNNGANLLADLKHMLSTYRPAHIFVTSEWDRHPDHRAACYFIQDALAAVRRSARAYDPTLHKTIVWNNFSDQRAWPAPGAPTTYFSEPPGLFERTGLRWSQRESLDVPLAIQTSVLKESLKWRAIDAHDTQGGNNGYIGQWVHKDEFFWTTLASESDRPPIPDAGTDQTAGPGAAVVLDGTGSFDPDGAALTYQWRHAEGPNIMLADANSARPRFTVPIGTPAGKVFTFELKVSDGTSTSVADAVSVRVDFTPPPDAGQGAPDASAGFGLVQ